MDTESDMNIYSDSRRRRIRGKKKSGRGWIIAGFAVVVAVCGALSYVSWKKMNAQNAAERLHNEMSAAVNVQTFYKGIVVQGVDLGGMTMDQAKAAVAQEESTADGTYSYKITFEKQSWELTQKDLTFTYDTDAVLEKAYSYARTGTLEARYAQIQALKTTPVKYSLKSAPNADSLKDKVAQIAAGIKKDAVEPTVASFDAASETFSFKDGTPGYTADGDTLWTEVKALVESGAATGTAAVKTKPVACKKTVDDIRSHMAKLGSFQTVSTNNANGTFNMKKALSTANGVCIAPGATYSFFDVAGPCDEDNGYLQAGALLHGKHIDEYGGGICQASTTIYGAALRSNLEVVERYNHSLPSSYCKIGQDATVSYPDLDLKLKNDTEYPVYIVTYSEGRTLTAAMYGYQSPDYDDIEIVSKVTETIPAPTDPVYTEDDTLAKGVVKLVQVAHTGYRATATRVYYKDGKEVDSEVLNTSYYPALPAYYSYGKGTDPSVYEKGSSSSSSSAAASSSAPAASSSEPAQSSSSEASSEASSGVTHEASPAESESASSADTSASAEGGN